MRNKINNIKSVNSFTNNIKGARFITILITTLMLLSGITLIPNSPIVGNALAASGEKYDFNLVCKSPVGDVGNTTGPAGRTIIYLIEVVNYNDSIGPLNFLITLNIENISDDANWAAGFTVSFQQTITVFFSPLNVSGDVKSVNLYVRAETTAKEDSVVIVLVNGTAEGAYTQFIETVTTMNSYDVEIECDDPYQFIAPGYSTNYTINVSNVGKLEDTFDIVHSQPSSPRWDIDLYYFDTGQLLFDTDTDGIPDTGPIAMGSFRVIRAEITAQLNAQKYHQELIYINASTNTDPSGTIDTDPQFTMSTVVNLTLCISDNDPSNSLFSGQYPGHNVNPGMMTTYAIDVFNTGSGNYVNLTIDSVPPLGWDATLGYNGANEDYMNISFSEIPNVGDYISVFLNITAAEGATTSDTATIAVSAANGIIVDNIETTTHVINKLKLIMIVYNGVNNASLGLDVNGDPYDGSAPRLWQNVTELIKTGSRYNNTIDIHLVGADPNYVGMITSSRTSTHGIFQVYGDYVGINKTTGLPMFVRYTHENVQANTLFNTIRDINPNLRTAIVNAKFWIGDIMGDEDVDLNINGYYHPYYIREPETYQHGPPLSAAIMFTGEVAKSQPSDKWIFDAAIETILYEDPDVILITNVEPDNAGHAYGSEIDENPTSINPFANKNNMLWVMRNLDNQTGRFFQLLKDRIGLNGRNAYNESIIVVSADHGMRTYYPANGPQGLDFNEFLANKGFVQGRDYEYGDGFGPIGAIYNLTNEGVREQARNELLNNYTDPILNTEMIWRVLNQTGMSEDKSDREPSSGQPFAIYNPNMVNIPDLLILGNETHQVPTQASTNVGFAKLVFSQYPIPSFYPRRLKSGLIGNHGIYLEQSVPLIFHGPPFKKDYYNTIRVEILNVTPTICEINGWKNPTWPGDGYFEDHEAEGDVLWDCMKNVHNVNKNTWYDIIQEAIDDANPCDEIVVYPGVYYEYLTVDKQGLKIRGANQGTPTYHGGKPYGYTGQTSIITGDGTGIVVNITAEGVHILGLTVENGEFGIYSKNCQSLHIWCNTIRNCTWGMYLRHPGGSIISSNTISNCTWGIYSDVFETWLSMFIYLNDILFNTKWGIKLDYHGHFLPTVLVGGNYFEGNGDPIDPNSGAIDIDPPGNSPHSEFDDNVIKDNIIGINLSGGSNITFTNNLILDNDYGLSISNSHNISIIGNTIYDNTNYGIYIDSLSQDNIIYHNNFQNLFNANDYGTNNQWDNQLEGNWWSDNQNPNDANGDGICDVPYSGSCFTDYYPLANEDNDRVHVGNFSFWFIQSAINFAKDNDIFYVDIGGYYETVTTDKTLTAIGDMIILRGDLTILSGSTLTLQDTHLIMDCSYDGEFTINVNGTLHLINSILSSFNPQHRYKLLGSGNIFIQNSDIRNVHPDSTFGEIEGSMWYGSPLIEYPTLNLLFSAIGGEKIAYLRLLKTADILHANLDLTGEIWGSSYPTNLTMDVGNDGIVEWSHSGELTSTVAITDLNTNPIFSISAQNYLDNHQPDENGYIYVPISFSSESEGKLIISNIKVGYTNRWTWGEFSKPHVHPGCYYYKFAIDIYYNGAGGIRIDDSLCPYIDYINTISEENWAKSATIKHNYYDEDNNGIIDDTTIPESTLKMYWWDENTQSWIPCADVFGEENTGVNTVDNYVWTNVDCFSSFTAKGSYVPIAETEALIETLESMEIQEGIKNSLILKLEEALEYLNAAWDNFVNGDLVWGNENLTLAKNKLNDFINEVEAQRGKAISEEDADILINDAQEIIALIDEAYA